MVRARVHYVGTGLSGRWQSLYAVLRTAGKPMTPPGPTSPVASLTIEVAGRKVEVDASASRSGVGYGDGGMLVPDPDPLADCTGLIFIVDSQSVRAEANEAALELLAEKLAACGRDLASIPIVFQVNKRDLPEIVSMQWVRDNLRTPRCDYIESIAPKRLGTMEAMIRLLELIDDQSYSTERLYPQPIAKTELTILYDGSAGSGCTTSMRHVHSELRFRGAWECSGSFPGNAFEFVFPGRPITLRVLGRVGAVHAAAALYEARRRADAIVFVVDCQRRRMKANGLAGSSVAAVFETTGVKPTVLQLNKRDLDTTARSCWSRLIVPPQRSIDELTTLFNRWGGPVFASTATRGIGVREAFDAAVLLAGRARGVESETTRFLEQIRA